MLCPHRLLAGPLALLAAAPCTAQQWLALDGPRPFGQTAYDARRDRLVTFGADGVLWEHRGDELLLRARRTGEPWPIGRRQAALTYDSVRGEVLMFGGITNNPLGDTWVWDGQSWRQPFSTITPPRRYLASLAFDAARGRAVLHGGLDQRILDDTWEWDGSSWWRMAPANVPGPAQPRSITYDRVRQRVVMSGMFTSLALEMLEWNGSDWVPRPVGSGGPWLPQRSLTVHDPVRDRLVCLSRSLTTPGHLAADIHEWDGSGWTRVGDFPADRIPTFAYWEATGSRCLIVTSRPASGPSGAVFAWDGAALAPVSDDYLPAAVTEAVWAWEPSTRTALQYGGTTAFVHRGLPWRWNGTRWSPTAAPPGGPDMTRIAATTDLVRGRVLVFGGGTQTVSADFWTWTGSSWQALPQGPPARQRTAIAHDPQRDRVVLFGGDDGTNVLGDTWEFDGSAWTQRLPAASPSPRSGAGLAHDAGRGRTVLFGGSGNADTWAWDGAQWSQWQPSVPGAPSPQAAARVSMAYDRSGGRVVLVQDVRIGTSAFQEETWAFDGADWRQLATRPGAHLAQLLYDERHERVLSRDSALLRVLTPTPGSVEVYAPGCGTAALRARTRPRRGEPAFGFEVETGAAGRPALVALGLATASTPLAPGCVLAVAPASTLLRLSGSDGVAAAVTSLPDAAALVGVAVLAQAATLAPSAPGFSLSAALRVTVGD